MRKSAIAAVALTALVVVKSEALTLLYDTGAPTAFYAPFNSSTAAGTKFGDSGWFGSGSDLGQPVVQVELGLATYSSTPQPAGTADLVFTFNDGDPSGLVFGTAAQLYSTVIPNVTLPATNGSDPTYFTVTIPTPGVMTTGGFNNVGWSLGVQNFSFGGSFGFQNHGNFNNVGLFTNNASQFNPSTNSWSLFAFGPAYPGDIANFVTAVYTPEPGTFTSLGVLSFFIARRRRTV